MRKNFSIFFLCLIFFLLVFFLNYLLPKREKKSEVANQPKERPLEKYTIANLEKTQIEPGRIEIIRKISEEENFTSFLFQLTFKPDFTNIKKVSGQINIPSQNAKSLPLVVMLRGYINQKDYKTGDGTRNAAKYFAKNGFVTIAPDFLGYGESDKEAENIFETRFQTYTTTLCLIKTLENLKKDPSIISGLEKSSLDNLANYSSILIWGHSNGGHIALTILAITGKSYPTTLWAPVSKPFPYSILYYTDEAEDGGKLIRSKLSEFEKNYNPNLFSFNFYLENINAPLQIHQGTNDSAVPFWWTDEFVQKLKKLNKEVTYCKYQGVDHNMRQEWNTVVARDLEFFKTKIKEK